MCVCVSVCGMCCSVSVYFCPLVLCVKCVVLFQIAPAKKLWGVEEGKADNKGIFNIGEASWREAAWSTGAPHAAGPHRKYCVLLCV